MSKINLKCTFTVQSFFDSAVVIGPFLLGVNTLPIIVPKLFGQSAPLQFG